MNSMNDWFPQPESVPVTVGEAWRGLIVDSSGLELTPLYQEYWREAKPGESLGKLNATKKLNFNRASFTIVKSEGNGGIYHPSECRMLHLAEFKRLGSWPDKYHFVGSRKDFQERIGNSVPPLFMRSIAANIKSMLQTGKPIRMTNKLVKVKDYPALLEQAYQQMIAPREPDAPTVISTFAGGGGSSAGYHMAGFHELLAVEWDDNAVETLRLNFPGLDIYHGDIAKLSVEEVLRRTGLQPGELDVFDGSPPCQGFSTAGKRDFADDRNQLFREYVRLLRGLQPKVFVMENVSGMVKGKMKLIFAEILRELKASGYQVSARLLNAMYFNVPQSRERMIFIGVRNDLGIPPSHPAAESVPVPVGEAWGGHDARWIGVKQDRLTSDTSAAYHAGRKRRFSMADTAYAITKDGAFGCRRSDIVVMDNSERPVTKKELSRLASYPDSFKFIGDHEKQWARIGNSVPPLFMRSIARHIRTAILDPHG